VSGLKKEGRGLICGVWRCCGGETAGFCDEEKGMGETLTKEL